MLITCIADDSWICYRCCFVKDQFGYWGQVELTLEVVDVVNTHDTTSSQIKKN